MTTLSLLPLSFLLCQSLKFIVRHGDDGQDEIDEVKGSEKDIEHEEDDVPGSGRPQRDLVQVFPKVLSHEAEGTEVRGPESVEASVPVIGIGAEALMTSGSLRTHPRAGRIPAHDVIPRFFAHVPTGRIVRPGCETLVRQIPPPGQLLGVVDRVVPHAFLAQDTHVHLQTQQGKDGQGKRR